MSVGRDRRVPRVLPRRRRRPAGPDVAAAGVARADGLRYAAPWRQTLFKLRFPAAVPYLMPALRLAATAAVVGAIVAEISTGLKGGIGRLILEYARQATGDPAKVYTAVFGAAVLGLVDGRARRGRSTSSLMRNRPRESDDVSAAVEVAGVSARSSTRAARTRSTRSSTSTSTIAPGEFVSLIGPSGCGKSHAAAPDRQPHRADGGHDLGQRQAGRGRPGSTRTTAWRSSRPGCSNGAASPRTSSCRWS